MNINKLSVSLKEYIIKANITITDNKLPINPEIKKMIAADLELTEESGLADYAAEALDEADGVKDDAIELPKLDQFLLEMEQRGTVIKFLDLIKAKQEKAIADAAAQKLQAEELAAKKKAENMIGASIYHFVALASTDNDYTKFSAKESLAMVEKMLNLAEISPAEKEKYAQTKEYILKALYPKYKPKRTLPNIQTPDISTRLIAFMNTKSELVETIQAGMLKIYITHKEAEIKLEDAFDELF